MSIVHVDKIWVKIAKNLEMQTSEGGWSVISDIPDEGGGGSKKGKSLRTSFMDGPLLHDRLFFSNRT